MDFPLSLHETFNLVKAYIWKTFKGNMKCPDYSDMFDINKTKQYFTSLNRSLSSLMYRWKLDAFKTKYVKNIVCLCGNKITPCHIFSCNNLKASMPVLMHNNVQTIFKSPTLIYDLFASLEQSSIGLYL